MEGGGVSEHHIKLMALFFYYVFLDKHITLKATRKAFKIQKKMLAHKQSQATQQPLSLAQKSMMDPIVLMISTCLEVWQKYKKHGFHQKNKNLQGFYDIDSHEHGFSASVDLGPWCDFLKEAEEHVILVVIFSQVLLLSDKDIAKGMGVSIGTVRYRLGYGLRLLGSMYPYGVTRLCSTEDIN